MGLLGDFAKGFVIMTVAGWIFAIAVNIATGQLWIVLLLLVLLIPFSMIAYEYLRFRKKYERTPRAFSKESPRGKKESEERKPCLSN